MNLATEEMQRAAALYLVNSTQATAEVYAVQRYARLFTGFARMTAAMSKDE